MKKITALLLTLLYLSTATGLALHVHYCLGQVMSVKLYQAAPNCKILKRNKLPDCCKSKHINLKVKDSHQPAKSSFAAGTMAIVLPSRPVSLFYSHMPQVIADVQAYRGPPGIGVTSRPLFLRNCTFRI